MRHRPHRLAIAGILLIPMTTSAATRVDLVIDEPFAQRSVAWPVTTGVPFPRGALTAENHCRLVDDLGTEQTLQSKATATWDPQRSSIRWLTIDFIARPQRSYSLEFGPDIDRKQTNPEIHVGRNFVRTDSLQVNFTSRGLEGLILDSNGDRNFDTHETVAVRPDDGVHYYLDQNGRRFFSGRSQSNSRTVIETTGPIRTCLRVDGEYSGPDGKSLVAVRTRYHVFAGLNVIKVMHEFRILGSTRDTTFRDIGFQLQIPQTTSGRTVIADSSGAAGNQPQSVLWKSDTTSVSSFQETYRHFGNPECRGVITETRSQEERVISESDHVGEWIHVRNDRTAITGSLRWMWQQFPKEWEVTSDRLTLHLWSPRSRQLDFGPDGIRDIFGPGGQRDLLEWNGTPKRLDAISNFFYRAGHSALAQRDVDGRGINKHHEFWLHFAPATEADQGMEYGMLAAQPPLVLATPEWNCSTDVFGPLEPRSDSKYEGIVDRLFDLGRYAQDAFGDYGWWIFGSGPHYSYQWDKDSERHYADPRRFEYHTYQKETQLWWNYFRTGERKFYDWAIPSENHWVDIAVTHVPVTYQCKWRGGFEKQQTLHMRPGDWSIDSPLFYIRQRDSAEAWLRGCSQFQASYHRTLETTTLAYYITGDERFNDVIEFWRDYWSDLAGKTSASPDLPVWIREQPWYRATRPGEPAKSWAEMIRDYCPFTSGLRHQMTYFFSLATLYEHTWDPVIGQVLRECAAAYLDPEHRIGVWRTQENRLPVYADAPKLAHYWVPALWKYARATQDPAMPDIFRRYFAACYEADPFREDVGQYSDVHLGYAYYFTRNPEHLRPAVLALDRLLPNAEPLQTPQELNRRLYNPYAPIQSFTAVPRLLWALNEAEKHGVAVGPEPVSFPQRTAIGIHKRAGHTLECTLWGYDKTLRLFGPDGVPNDAFELTTRRASSQIQPFDRVAPDFEVFLHELTIPADEAEGSYVIVPTLELAVLRMTNEPRQTGRGAVVLNAARPINIHHGREFEFAVPQGLNSLDIETDSPPSIIVTTRDGEPLKLSTTGNRVAVDVRSNRRIHIRRYSPNRRDRRPVWFRLLEIPQENCWARTLPSIEVGLPSKRVTQAALPADDRAVDLPNETFVEGRFGRGLLMSPGRKLHIPDHISSGDEQQRLFDLREGTIEFHVKQLWDPRISGTQLAGFLRNGLVTAWNQQPLPLREWTHMAFEWRPLKRDPTRIALHIYVDGIDRRNYRSTWWEGYSQKPLTLPANGKWLREFVSEGRPSAPFAIDEIRVSTVARYAKPDIELGGEQVFNPARFQPPTEPFKVDDNTTLLLHLDGDARIQSSVEGVPVTAGIEE